MLQLFFCQRKYLHQHLFHSCIYREYRAPSVIMAQLIWVNGSNHGLIFHGESHASPPVHILLSSSRVFHFSQSCLKFHVLNMRRGRRSRRYKVVEDLSRPFLFMQ